jgi:hypothetical protein
MLVAPLSAQPAANPPEKHAPAKIDQHLLLFPESVVSEQWTHTLNLVNPPQNLKLLNPGQCIRIGVVATGDGRDSFLEKTQISFRVQFAGQMQDHALAPLSAIKQIKPEGGDFVTQALAAANVDNPLKTMASLGAAKDNWCVPADAKDGTAAIEAEIKTPSGLQKLAPATIPIESFETGSKWTFKSPEEFEQLMMGYHYQPFPAHLYAAVKLFAADPKLHEHPENLLSFAATIGAALKTNPDAAKDFIARLTNENSFPVRAIGMVALQVGGYDIGPVRNAMSEDDKKLFGNPEFPDPYDFSHPEDVAKRFDMLWGMFATTGEFSPIQKIATALAWRGDWEDFDKARKSANPPHEWTPAIGRAVAYGAAGWSLSSFQQTDPLAADYIEDMIASPDTPDLVKSELKILQTDPAFRRTD